MDFTSISINCPYCGTHTALMMAPVNINTPNTQGVRAIWQKEGGDLWWIGLCAKCWMAVLVHEEQQHGPRYTFYPNPLPSATDDRISDPVRRDLAEAKLCFSVDAYRACAVMARRAIQTACIEKGATKGQLVGQLHELADKAIITKDLQEWGDVVRWVGNDAAHHNGDEVTKEDAEDILRLAEQFMHAVYVAPAIAQELRAKRGK
jgi:hypothetical protein